MIYLAIDTATEICSAALFVNGETYFRDTRQPRLHAELILPFVDELIQESGISRKQIDGIIVGQGPGAFTGVRIGVSVAQALALALDVKVVPVSNLEALAFKASEQIRGDKPSTLIVATDARMNEVYWAKYRIGNERIELLSPERVAKPETVDLSDADYYIGSGFCVYDVLKNHALANPTSVTMESYPHAKDMLMMVKDKFNEESIPATEVLPVYLREP